MASQPDEDSGSTYLLRVILSACEGSLESVTFGITEMLRRRSA